MAVNENRGLKPRSSPGTALERVADRRKVQVTSTGEAELSVGQYQAEVDRVDAPGWASWLGRFADANIYQTWAYGAAHWGESNLSHLVLRREGEVAAMAQLRIVRFRFPRCGIAYLRWGPLCHLRGQELGLETASRMAVALRDEYVRRRGLFLRILPSAFAGSARARIFQAAFSQFTSGVEDQASVERTFLVDLAPPLNELRKRLDQKWRNQLNRAEKNGLEVAQGDQPELYRSFVEMYRQMWARKRFDEGVNVAEFGRIQEALPPSQKMRVIICSRNGVPVAGIVCAALGESAVYLLGATSDEGLQAKGAYLLQWTMIQWLKEKGVRWYDLGGINPAQNPGVYHFKRGLSGEDVRRIAPLEACGSFASLWCMRAADFAKGNVQALRQPLKKAVARLMTHRDRLPPGERGMGTGEGTLAR